MAWPFIRKPELVDKEPPMPPRRLNTPTYSYNKLFDRLLTEQPKAQQFTFFMPEADSVTILEGRTHHDPTFLNFAIGKSFVVSRYTGESMGGTNLAYYERNNQIAAGALLIHMGFWGGLTTKLITFLSGLIGASLPITGFLIWRGRRKKPENERLAQRSLRNTTS